jgi:hypothetical protein
MYIIHNMSVKEHLNTIKLTKIDERGKFETAL